MRYVLLAFEETKETDIGLTSWLQDHDERMCNNTDFKFSREVSCMWPSPKDYVCWTKNQISHAARKSSRAMPQSCYDDDLIFAGPFVSKVLRFGDTYDELIIYRTEAMNGKVNLNKGLQFGRGNKRNAKKKFFDDDSDSDNVSEAETPEQLKKKLRVEKKDLAVKEAAADKVFSSAVVKAIQKKKADSINTADSDSPSTSSNKLMQKSAPSKKRKRSESEEDSSLSDSDTEPSSFHVRDEVRCLKSDVLKLKQENQALRNTLRLNGALPQLLEDVEKLRSKMQRDRSPKHQAHQEALLLSPIRRPQTKPVKTTSPPQAQPTTHDDLTTLSGEVLVASSQMTKINFSSERKLVNDLLFTVFGREVLQNHSLRGAVCNVHKKSGAGGTRPPLDQEKVNAVEAYVKNFFSTMSPQDFNKYGNDKIKNCRRKPDKSTS